MQFNDESIVFARFQEPSKGIPFLVISIRPNSAVDEGYSFEIPADRLDHDSCAHIRRFAEEVDRRNERRANDERDKPVELLGFKVGDPADDEREAQVQAALRMFYESQETLMRLGKTPPKTDTVFGPCVDPPGEDGA